MEKDKKQKIFETFEAPNPIRIKKAIKLEWISNYKNNIIASFIFYSEK